MRPSLASLFVATLLAASCGPKTKTNLTPQPDTEDGGGGAGGGGGRAGAPDAAVDQAQVAVDAPEAPDVPVDTRVAVDMAVSPPDLAPDIAREAPPPDGSVLQPPPAPWQAAEIGGVVAGKNGVTHTSTALTITGSGPGVAGAKDSLYFVYQALKGDGEVVARVSTPPSDPSAAAGIMVRTGMGDDALFVTVLFPGDATVGGRFGFRSMNGANGFLGSPDPNTKSGAAGSFVRITRKGTRFQAERSGDRKTWAPIGALDLPVTADQELYWGAAADGGTTMNGATSTFSYLALDNLAALPATAAWRHVDLGTLGGSALYWGGALTLSGFGDAFNDTSTNGVGQEFGSLVVQQVKGAYTLTAKVASISGDPAARVGVMIREGAPDQSASRSAAHALISISTGRGLQFRYRAGQGGTVMEGTPRSDIMMTPIWLRIERVNTTVAGLPTSIYTGSYSTDGTSFMTLDTQMFSMADQTMLGVFVDGASPEAAQVRFENITFTAAPVPDGGAGPDGSSADAKLDAVSGG